MPMLADAHELGRPVVIPVGDRCAADLFVLVFGGSRSGEIMIVSVPFAFQVRSLQGLVKLETELARRMACRAQVKQLKSEKLSPCSRGNQQNTAHSPLIFPGVYSSAKLIDR